MHGVRTFVVAALMATTGWTLTCGADQTNFSRFRRTLSLISTVGFAIFTIPRVQAIAQQIIESPSPGFVGVAADVDAPGELHLTGFGILHVDIDVQDEVAHLLHGAPRGPIGAGPLRELSLAAVAVAR